LRTEARELFWKCKTKTDDAGTRHSPIFTPISPELGEIPQGTRSA